MPGDPKECREQAEFCRQQADQSEDGVSCRVWLDISRQWITLAVNYEIAEAFLQALGEEEG